LRLVSERRAIAGAATPTWSANGKAVEQGLRPAAWPRPAVTLLNGGGKTVATETLTRREAFSSVP